MIEVGDEVEMLVSVPPEWPSVGVVERVSYPLGGVVLVVAHAGGSGGRKTYCAPDHVKKIQKP